MTLFLPSFLALVSALTTIFADYGKQRRLVYLCKPLTLVFLLGLAARSPRADGYQLAIGIGLLLSLLGDVYLMLDKQRFFRQGLIAFLAAHMAYIAGFGLGHGYGLVITVSWPVLLLAVTYGALLWPSLAGDRLPVAVYLATIALMACEAFSQLARMPSLAHGLAAIGAGLFVFSDACLAWNRFRKPFHAAQALILSSYFLAQWCITLSLF